MPLPPGDFAAPVCGACLGRRHTLRRTLSAFAYADPVSTLVAGYKYRAALQAGRVLGELLGAQLQHQYCDCPLPDVIVPVPLHPVRLRERGFNQALVLAQQLGQRLHIPVLTDALVRVRATPPQKGLSAKERKRNLRGAFELRKDLGDYAAIALVDDVVTTMSTVREITRVLRRHHADCDVDVWCLARA